LHSTIKIKACAVSKFTKSKGEPLIPEINGSKHEAKETKATATASMNLGNSSSKQNNCPRFLILSQILLTAKAIANALKRQF